MSNTPVLAPAEPLLTTEAAAALLGVKPQTLCNWRCTQRQRVPFVRVGGRIRYRRADLEAWVVARRVAGEAEGQTAAGG